MSLGFNSDVPVGNDVFHVQTENYGEPQYTIVTLVYLRGRILHRRNSNYSDLIATAGFSEKSLNGRVEDQHRSVIEEVRKGAISIPSGPVPSNNSGSQGIQVRLRNAGSWFSAGQASLDLEVIQRKGNAPVEGAKVEAFLTGSKAGAQCEAETGVDGLARIQFAIPNAAANGAELVIRARAGKSQATDEIRFILRPKQPGPAKIPKSSAKQERE
jgi:hypothetical protein